MTQLTNREEIFRTAIAAFIEARREAKLKGKDDDADTASKYDYETWLADAARRVGQIQAVSHVLKATHPDARGSSLHVAPAKLPELAEIGTHLLGEDYAEDVVGNAAAAHFNTFLNIEIDGKRLLYWMQAGDADVQAALSNDAAQAQEWMRAFAALVREETQLSSHPMAKQVYWLIGGDPLNNAHYHLMQPMFASSLAHVVYVDIQDARFSDANKEAKQKFHAKEPHQLPYKNYRGVVEQHLGALPKPTNKSKHLNISHLNAERLGRNYLLASLPPKWDQDRFRQLLHTETALDRFAHFKDVRFLMKTLVDFLLSNPDKNVRTRDRREAIEQALGFQLPVFAASVQARSEPGWTRNPDCNLPLCEQLWLDPERIELPLREGHEQDDENFIAAYHRGDWPDEVAGRFANWVNAQLHAAGLTTVGDAEYKHWAKQAIVDAAWPVPLQRRAPIRGDA